MLDLAIDACRIPFESPADEADAKGRNAHGDLGSGPRGNAVYGSDDAPRSNYAASGRYPANVVLDEAAAAMLDDQSGPRRASKAGVAQSHGIYRFHGDNGRPSNDRPREIPRRGYDDIGGASRFFYCPKASRRERDAGLEGMPAREWWSGAHVRPGQHNTSSGRQREARPSRNYHPTVKPLALMRWLVRLVTPAGGTSSTHSPARDQPVRHVGSRASISTGLILITSSWKSRADASCTGVATNSLPLEPSRPDEPF